MELVSNPLLITTGLIGLAGLVLYARWFRSNWRAEQIVAIGLIDRLIRRVILLANRPDSGLSAAEIGDLKGDWQRVSAELSSHHSFGAWIRSGRMNHAIEDPYARALSIFARRRVDPLHAVLHSQTDGRLQPYLVDEIFEVLSVDIDELATRNARVIQVVPASAALPARAVITAELV